MSKLFVFLLVVALLIASQPTARIEMRMCANCGGSCGIVPHTFWMQWDHADTYTDDTGATVTAVPMFAQCTVCGYSMYEDHVVVSREEAHNAD
jgi:hypothetical protein